MPGETPAAFVRRVRGDESRERWAVSIGLTSKTIARIEAGEAIGKKAAVALAQHTGVPVGYFMSEEASEETVEPVEDEALPATELAIRLLRPMDDDVEQELRRFAESEVQFSTGAEIAPIMWALEQKKRELVAQKRGRDSHVGERAPEPKAPSQLMPRKPKKS